MLAKNTTRGDGLDPTDPVVQDFLRLYFYTTGAKYVEPKFVTLLKQKVPCEMHVFFMDSKEPYGSKLYFVWRPLYLSVNPIKLQVSIRKLYSNVTELESEEELQFYAIYVRRLYADIIVEMVGSWKIV